MRIEFDEIDANRAKEYESGKYCKLIPDVGNYSLNIKVLDIGKANAFLSQILMKKEIVSTLNDKAGIKITSVNLYPAIQSCNIKDELKDLIQRIENEEGRFC